MLKVAPLPIWPGMYFSVGSLPMAVPLLVVPAWATMLLSKFRYTARPAVIWAAESTVRAAGALVMLPKPSLAITV